MKIGEEADYKWSFNAMAGQAATSETAAFRTLYDDSFW